MLRILNEYNELPPSRCSLPNGTDTYKQSIITHYTTEIIITIIHDIEYTLVVSSLQLNLIF